MIKINFLTNEDQELNQLDKVTIQIAIDILTGELKKGQRIIENKFCEKYGIGRPPLRQILNRLSAQQLITLIPNRGAFVKGLSDTDITDIFYLKSIIYPQAVFWAAERMTVEEIDYLSEIYNFINFYTPTGDIEKVLLFCRGFDKLIYNCTKNSDLEFTLNKYDFYIKYSLSNIHFPKNYLNILNDEYTEIYRAILKRNPDLAKECAENHMFHSLLRVNNNIEQETDDSLI